MPKFSIVIPVFNKEPYIKECLKSVLSQRNDDYEIIVVDDGSTDNSANIIKNLNSEKIRYIYKKNGGVSSARNLGIREANGEWITFIDADDIMYPIALEVYNSLIHKYPEAKVVVASVDQNRKKYPSMNYDYIVKDYPYSDAINYAKNGFSLICSDCICIRRDLLDKTNGFNEKFSHGEDMDLWYRLSLETSFAKSEIPVALYNIGTINNSSTTVESKRRYAPIAVLERPRSCFPNYSLKLLQGGKVFFNTIPLLLKNGNKKAFKLLFKYIDWTILFSLYMFYFRIIKKTINCKHNQ